MYLVSLLFTTSFCESMLQINTVGVKTKLIEYFFKEHFNESCIIQVVFSLATYNMNGAEFKIKFDN